MLLKHPKALVKGPASPGPRRTCYFDLEPEDPLDLLPDELLLSESLCLLPPELERDEPLSESLCLLPEERDEPLSESDCFDPDEPPDELREPLFESFCWFPPWLRLPASRASSEVNSWALPEACAARPPSAAISR